MSNIGSVSNTPAKKMMAPTQNLADVGASKLSERVRRLLTVIFGDHFYKKVGNQNLYAEIESLLKQNEIPLDKFVKTLRSILRRSGMYIYFSNASIEAVFGKDPLITPKKLVERLSIAAQQLSDRNIFTFFAADRVIMIDTKGVYDKYLGHIPIKIWAKYCIQVLYAAYKSSGQNIISNSDKKFKSVGELQEAILKGEVTLNEPNEETKQNLVHYAIQRFERGMAFSGKYLKKTWADVAKKIGLPYGQEFSGSYMRAFVHTCLLPMIEANLIMPEGYTPKTYPKGDKKEALFTTPEPKK